MTNVATKKTPAPRRAGTATKSATERSRLVRVMLEIALLDRAEYRTLRAEMWLAVARSHNRKAVTKLHEWNAQAS